MKRKISPLNLPTFVLLAALAVSVPSPAADMADYTALPPFAGTSQDPNILLVMDESGSMQFPAYLPCHWGGYSSSRARCGTSSDPAYAYDPAKDYYGLFKTDRYYQYSSNKFVENASCNFTDRIGGPGCISGNILNWATMSRVDVTKKALIGGKAVSQQGNIHTLQGEGGWWTYSDGTLGCTFDLSGGSYPNLDHVLTIIKY